MDKRTIERFRRRVIWIHWIHMSSSIILLVTGTIMFLGLTGVSSGQEIRAIHKIAAVFFVIVPVLFTVFDPKAVMSFLKEAFHWDRDNLVWLRSSLRFYFGRKVQMPPQGYINGDQKLWQLIVIVTGFFFVLTGIMMWFFKLKMPLVLYQYAKLTHATSFIIFSLMFIVHFYLTTLHYRFEESLSSMVDGKISSSYAQEHYSKWYQGKTGAE